MTSSFIFSSIFSEIIQYNLKFLYTIIVYNLLKQFISKRYYTIIKKTKQNKTKNKKNSFWNLSWK